MEDGRLEIIDPLGNITFLTEEGLNKIIDTDMGRRMLVVQKLPADFFENLNQQLANIGY